MRRAADELWASLPLRERLPEYLALFGTGLAFAAVLGLLIGLIFKVPLVVAVGYTLFGFGLFYLLGGGSQGGRYGTLGFGAGAGRVKFVYDQDPHVVEDLRRDRRPDRNPAAFWMVVAGALYAVLGLLLASLG